MRKRVREIIRETIAQEMRRNEKVFLIGEDVGVYGGAHRCSEGLLEEFGAGRVIDTPISEIGFTGLAVGASWAGLHPICEYMTFNFALQALDHIVNSAAKTLYMSGGRVCSPILFRGPHGYAPGVAAQHTQDLAAVLCSLPGIKVVAPYSAKDHIGVIRAALRERNPVVILESEVLYAELVDTPEELQNKEFIQSLGKAVIEAEGERITLVGIGITVGLCVEAQRVLIRENVSVEVINLLSINPLDTDTISESVRKTKGLLIVDWALPECGVSTEIFSSVKMQLGDALERSSILTAKKVPTPYAEELEKLCYPGVEDILCAINMMLKRREFAPRNTM